MVMQSSLLVVYKKNESEKCFVLAHNVPKPSEVCQQKLSEALVNLTYFREHSHAVVFKVLFCLK